VSVDALTVSVGALTAPIVASLIGLAAAVVALTRLYANSKRSIMFDAWADFAQLDGEPGKSLADLLLFHIREIQYAISAPVARSISRTRTTIFLPFSRS
jgi:hypothetical protein